MHVWCVREHTAHGNCGRTQISDKTMNSCLNAYGHHNPHTIAVITIIPDTHTHTQQQFPKKTQKKKKEKRSQHLFITL